MKIEISPTLQPDNEGFRDSIKNTIHEVVISAVEAAGASAEDVEAVFITAQDDFGPTIHRLQDAAGLPRSYTDNEIHVAAAKTIAARRDGRVASTVVYRDNFMAEILGDLMGFDGEPTFGEGAQFCFYLLAHEAGHCKDNALRPEPEGPGPHFEGEFRAENVAKYYCPILLSELAACVHSAQAMTPAVYAQETGRWREDADKYLKHVKESWRAYQRNNSHLRNLAFDAAQTFWVILLQYAKLVGSRIGNPDLSDTADSSHGPNAGAASVFKGAEETLRRIWALYPDWGDAAGDALLRNWQELARSYGYRFVQSEEADGLFLDNSIIEGR